ncbi:MAG: hypothetical protein ABSG67_22300 [Thermoguttaceae bacterium]|jgi:Leucine-rich repeat (LRR) protein
MTPAQPTSQKPFRRWFQYSLRTLMILVTLFALACSWFAVKLGQARRQREAVEGIRKLGGSVTYDYECDSSNRIIKGAKAPGPAWLRNLLGIDCFCNVTQVWGRGKVSDAELVYLKCFPQLRIFFFQDAQITNDGLEIIQGLTQVQVLGLQGSKITDAGMQHFENMTQLKELYLQDNNITDDGLKYLQGLIQLQDLHLSDTQVTDDGLKHLKGLTNLIFLDLSNSYVSNAGLVHLKGLKKLETLDLSKTNVTDAGVQDLQKTLPNLKIER